MNQLVEFLLARIAEDAELARRVIAIDPRRDEVTNHVCYCDGQAVIAVNGHRMLAECAARRQIIEAHPPARRYVEVQELCDPVPRVVDAGWDVPVVLFLLAIPYSGHPDYREEWRP